MKKKWLEYSIVQLPKLFTKPVKNNTKNKNPKILLELLQWKKYYYYYFDFCLLVYRNILGFHSITKSRTDKTQDLPEIEGKIENESR